VHKQHENARRVLDRIRPLTDERDPRNRAVGRIRGKQEARVTSRSIYPTCAAKRRHLDTLRREHVGQRCLSCQCGGGNYITVLPAGQWETLDRAEGLAKEKKKLSWPGRVNFQASGGEI